MTPAARREMQVLHVCDVWLPQTMTWLNTLVACHPPSVVGHVVAARVENLDQFPLERLIAPRRRRPWLLRGLARLSQIPDVGEFDESVARLRPDLIHAHFGHLGWRAFAMRRDALHAKRVVSFYGLDVDYLPGVSPRWRRRYRDLFKAIDLVLALGPRMAGRLEAHGCPSSRIRIHHLGIELDDIPMRPRSWDPAGPLRILVAGSYREKKGIPFAVDAVARVAAAVPVELTIVGEASREPRSLAERDAILAAIQRSGLGERVTTIGYIPHGDLFDLAYRHHVFLAPSVTAADNDAEGTPMTLVEMAATGMPVVSTRHSDIPEIVVDGVTGLLAEERDVDGLVERIVWLAANPGEWEGMAARARHHVEANFDAVRQGERLADLYSELTSSHSAA